MNKIIRFSIPFILAFLFLGMLIWLAGASNQAVSNPSPSTIEVSILVPTLEDELNNDGDCSLREAITAANNNTVMDACPAGDAVITDTITFDMMGTIALNSQLEVTLGGPLVITGGGDITLNGGGTVRLIMVAYDSQLTLESLTLSDGYMSGSGGGLFC